MAAVEISCTSIRAYARCVVIIIRPGYKHFLTSNFADSKNIQFTIGTLSRPTLSITVTETIVKAQRRLQSEIETMEVESGSHRGQTILLSACSTAYYRHSAISGTTADTSLSLTITEHTLPEPWRRRLTSKISSYHGCLHYGKMAAVSIMRMHTGSYAHIIALINFGIP